MHHAQAYGNGVVIAPIGLVSMLNPGGAIQGFAVKTHGSSVMVHLDVKGCGPFLLHSTRPAAKVNLPYTPSHLLSCSMCA